MVAVLVLELFPPARFWGGRGLHAHSANSPIQNLSPRLPVHMRPVSWHAGSWCGAVGGIRALR